MMAKDPAFLFYYQDFLIGTSFFTNEQTGAYIKILAHLADKDILSEKHILNICNSPKTWEAIKDKFVMDNEGNFFNKRLREESTKRKEYAESRRQNRLGNVKSYDKHMEDEDEDVNINKERKKVSVDYFENLYNLYLLDFVNKLPLEIWKEWVNYRREIKKKLTKSIADKQLKFLILQSDPAGCINESIKNGWAGLFELKGKPKEPVKSSTLGQGDQEYKKVLEEANKQPKWRPK